MSRRHPILPELRPRRLDPSHHHLLHGQRNRSIVFAEDVTHWNILVRGPIDAVSVRLARLRRQVRDVGGVHGGIDVGEEHGYGIARGEDAV